MSAMPHDAPSSTELVEAVREWVESLAETGEPPPRFHALVARNMLAMVERELQLGPAHGVAHAVRLEQLGVGDDAELAAAIRNGDLDGRLDEVRDLVWASVRDKLAVANPRYLDRVESDER